ncbi:hypothetical protein C8R44DRAFT_820131 [Mycena epipterygia]|nr:hypothetical protein C8R44DRAFT_820131 [Mycena epipterygia]
MESPVPVLPPELERLIFEICASSRPVLIPKLMLVSWRVKDWVERLLYRTIAISRTPPIQGYPIFTTDIVLSAIRSTSKPADFFRDSVRNLLLHAVPEDTMKEILSKCTRVENLWASGVGRAARLLDLSSTVSLPLKQLYMNFSPLLPAIQARHPLFAQITHVELMSLPIPDDITMWCSTLSLLPRLTHLSFNDEDFIPMCLPFLQNCKLLAVLVSLDGKPPAPEYEDALARDPRFVVMCSSWFFKDWQMGVHVGRDYWSRAEDFIAKRRSGEIDARQYEMVEDETVYIA